MKYVTVQSNGKYQIDKARSFCELLDYRLPTRNASIIELFDTFNAKIEAVAPAITGNAMNNARGDWYEWLIGLSAWNFCVINPAATIAIPLPNISRFDVAQLYVSSLSDLIVDLRHKVKQSTNVQLVTSNPDFVLINRSRFDKHFNVSTIDKISEEILAMFDEVYFNFVGQCELDDIVGFWAVKSSLRPDRRLQISHEGSLMKALYTHLQTRLWILEPQGLKYYAITTKFTNADKKALRTVATHSITTVHTIPQAAVDGLFEVNSLAQADEVYQQILLPD